MIGGNIDYYWRKVQARVQCSWSLLSLATQCLSCCQNQLTEIVLKQKILFWVYTAAEYLQCCSVSAGIDCVLQWQTDDSIFIQHWLKWSENWFMILVQRHQWCEKIENVLCCPLDHEIHINFASCTPVITVVRILRNIWRKGRKYWLSSHCSLRTIGADLPKYLQTYSCSYAQYANNYFISDKHFMVTSL